MRRRLFISTSIRRLAISLLLLSSLSAAQAQGRLFTTQKDSIRLFQGFAVSFDLVGAGMLTFSDYGQYEGALRVNLRDEWFPIVEIGYGKAERNDEVTHMYYRTAAPYFRVGVDRNLLKFKHGPNRLYGGLRYAYTSYKVDIAHPDFPDPHWLWDTSFGVKDASCYYHWLEVVVGIDAKIVGPLHLGWSVRYKRRIAYSKHDFGDTWYVPGFGTDDDSKLGGTFNVIIDI